MNGSERRWKECEEAVSDVGKSWREIRSAGEETGPETRRECAERR